MIKTLLLQNLKRMAVVLACMPVLAGLLVWGSHAWIEKSAHGLCHDELAEVPAMDVALVLGCSPKLGSQPNPFYENRIQAAAALYKAGKIKDLIVSGDNSTHQYDEPTAMKASLVAAGVPEQHIYCDFAGFRTFDSVVRAQAIFDQKKFIVVSQRFHNERAVFLAGQLELEAVGYNAKDVVHGAALATHLREYLARVNAVLDVTLLQTKPKFYGPKVVIGARP